MDAILATHLLCAAVYLVLALLLARHSPEWRLPVVMLIAACIATSAWSLSVAAEAGLERPLGRLRGVLDVVRVVAWIGFLTVAYRVAQSSGGPSRRVRWAVAAGGALVLVLGAVEMAHPAARAQEAENWLIAGLYGRLLLVVTGLTLAEALVRQARAEGLWRVRYLCLGVGGLLVYDLFVWSDALLFHRLHPILDASRGAVGLIAAPLIAISAARNSAWSTDLHVARRVALHTAILLSVGFYLLGLAAAGGVLRATGGEWGLLLEAALLFGGLLLLVVLVLSPSTRSAVKRRLSYYLFTHRHDYREQWHQFAEALTSPATGSSLRVRALRALCDIAGCSRGGLWLLESGAFTRVAALGLPGAASGVPGEGRFHDELEQNGPGILELAGASEGRGGERPAWLPDWLREWHDAWLMVPLFHQERVSGFIVVCRTLANRRLHPEDEELLKTAAHHAASYLAADRTAQELAESRRFGEISRGLAFIAHDLRNLASQMTLSLANARDHIQKPEFQRDLLLSMEDSVAGMQRLLDKLAEHKREPVAPPSVDFAKLVRSSLRSRWTASPAVSLELEEHVRLVVACDPDRLISMTGHLIQNAVEAAGPSGNVCVRLARDGASSLFEVEDDGPGMTEAFVRERLNHPFRSSKRGGYGLGLFECRELARQAGGELAIDSEPGRGTLARLRLPLTPVPTEVGQRGEPDAGA